MYYRGFRGFLGFYGVGAIRGLVFVDGRNPA